MLILKKLKQPIDLGFITLEKEYVEKERKNNGRKKFSKKISG